MSHKNLSALKVRHQRIRKTVSGTAERPRLAVHFSGQHIYAQVIDDQIGKTLVSACTTEKTLRGANSRANAVTADKIGQLIADRASAKQVVKVVFDRGGFIYHGKVKALADSARAGGLQF